MIDWKKLIEEYREQCRMMEFYKYELERLQDRAGQLRGIDYSTRIRTGNRVQRDLSDIAELIDQAERRFLEATAQTMRTREQLTQALHLVKCPLARLVLQRHDIDREKIEPLSEDLHFCCAHLFHVRKKAIKELLEVDL